ncbi:MAG TPA: NADH-ubiquinone oxidoreductase-F iron-sulfur binding region domain-containing protein [Acidimicrobiia bacterium]|nr:NADH-ubiquinone oxidoreductase-F iron-sulfur binding region domain-containing protein [Acidimicrobiia bacterium]
MDPGDASRVLPSHPITDLAAYLAAGGGVGLERALDMGGPAVIETIRRSGLRGRGGAGFPTGTKWRGVAADAGPRVVVCNAAEGEPGTSKDRTILSRDPYRVIEGMAIAAIAVGAATAYLGIKARFTEPIAGLDRAAREMSAAGLLEGIDFRIVEGPDDYLLGVETALLEVIQGNDPLPRTVPPYIQGLVDPDGTEYATVVNNVETLAHVPGIVAHGADWFRSIGTERSPGTMVFTVSGDVKTPAVAELPLGTPLSFLIYGPGGGTRSSHAPKLIVSGASNRPLTAREIDTPMSFEGMEAIGSGLGSGGFIVYDDSTCAVEVGLLLSSFLQRGSCGQCPPCKLGTTAYMRGFGLLLEGRASRDDLDDLTGWLNRVTDGNRCGLGAGQREVARGILHTFADDVVACLEGRCQGHRGLTLPPPVVAS